MSPPVLGGLLGLAAVAGLLLVAARIPARRRPRLDDRLAPYLPDPARRARSLVPRTVTPFPTLERVFAPLLVEAVRLLERAVGGSATVRRRLVHAGREPDVESFRVEQLLWGAAGLLSGLGVSVLILGRGAIRDPLPAVLLCAIAALGGGLARDRWLSVEVARREHRLLAEFPTIAELLALAVAAGEGAAGALERVTRSCRGELSGELAQALAEARTGTPLPRALEGVAERTSIPVLARFVTAVAVAVERGTPLAELLRAQAVDVREAGRRELIESAGRKEIGMLAPVVFLILPVTVVFALFPGLVTLRITS